MQLDNLIPKWIVYKSVKCIFNIVIPLATEYRNLGTHSQTLYSSKTAEQVHKGERERSEKMFHL